MPRWTLAAASILFLAGCEPTTTQPAPVVTTAPAAQVTLTFSLSRYPNVADHVRDAQAAGESKVCTIDRPHADSHRKESLAGIATRPGMDRDEYPPAMCAEGGRGADVRLVPSAENRSSGSWMRGRLAHYPNGTRVLLKVGN